MSLILKYRELLLAAIIIVLIAIFSYRAPGFASLESLANIFNDTSILMILALGQMAVILTKSIDLSMAANLSFTGMAIAMINAAYPQIPLPLLIVMAMGTGALLGAINGFMIWKIGIPSIVATLGTLTIYRGMAFVLSGGAWVNQTQMTPAFLNTPRIAVLGLPLLGWAAVLVIAIISLVFTSGRLGVVDLTRNGVYGYDIITELLGTQGTLRVGYIRETPLLIMTKGVVAHDTVPYFMERFAEAYTAQLENFAQNVLQGRQPPITVDDGIQALRIAVAATRAQQTGQRVEVAS